MIEKMPVVKPMNYNDQPELCFHHLLDGKGRLTIIRSLSKHDHLRYSEFLQLISDISQRALSLQLKELERLNLISKKDFNEYPKHTEYSLTEFGKSLVPIVDSICVWYANEYQSYNCQQICEPTLEVES